jgi:cysteine desulfurase
LQKNFEEEHVRIQELRNEFWRQLKNEFPAIQLNGPTLENRATNNLNITFVGYRVPPSFANIAVSRGSACHSGATHASPVLKAIGVSSLEAEQGLRLSIGRWTTHQDLQAAVESLKQGLQPLA